MWIASSTSPAGGAGPSATSCGSIPREWASPGTSSRARKRMRVRNIVTALVGDRTLVEVGTKPALGLLDGDAAAAGIILELVAADARDAEILAVSMAEVKSGDSRGRKHREILGQRDLAGIS